jgi:hypothetical protein
VFPSQDAALDDARNNSKLAVRARNFTVHSSDISSRANGGMKISRSFWWASSTNRAGDNDSQFMSVNPVAAKDVEKNSNHALESLKIAHIDDGDAQQ